MPNIVKYKVQDSYYHIADFEVDKDNLDVESLSEFVGFGNRTEEGLIKLYLERIMHKLVLAENNSELTKPVLIPGVALVDFYQPEGFYVTGYTVSRVI